MAPFLLLTLALACTQGDAAQLPPGTSAAQATRPSLAVAQAATN